MLLDMLHETPVKCPVPVLLVTVLYRIHSRISIADEDIGILGIIRKNGHPCAS